MKDKIILSMSEEKLSALESERDGLEARHFEGIDLAEARERLADLSARYEEMAKEAPESADTAAIDERLRELQQKLAMSHIHAT